MAFLNKSAEPDSGMLAFCLSRTINTPLSRTSCQTVSCMSTYSQSNGLTGVKKLSATNRALAFNCVHVSALTNQHLLHSMATHEELHLRDLLIHLLHELYYKVHQLVLQHLLGMVVGDQERDIVALVTLSAGHRKPAQHLSIWSYRHRFPPQYEECLRSLGQEPSELVHENMLDLVCLLYPYADPHTIDRWLDKDSLFLIS
jgi:hypothetical protein